MRSLLALLAMLGFVVSAVVGFVPTTRAGVQCPTAPVRTVTVRDCCGHLVTRAPSPGEKEFKQCRCEEKRQAPIRVNASPRNEALVPERLTFDVPAPIQSEWSEPVYKARGAAWSIPPALRPPTVS